MRSKDEAKPDLTERQLQIVALIARGCSNDEVGERLGISPRTAKAHSDALRQKLGIDVELTREQVSGLVPPSRRPGDLEEHAVWVLSGDDVLRPSMATLNPSRERR